MSPMSLGRSCHPSTFFSLTMWSSPLSLTLDDPSQTFWCHAMPRSGKPSTPQSRRSDACWRAKQIPIAASGVAEDGVETQDGMVWMAWNVYSEDSGWKFWSHVLPVFLHSCRYKLGSTTFEGTPLTYVVKLNQPNCLDVLRLLLEEGMMRHQIQICEV